jgi:hypothetical protein
MQRKRSYTYYPPAIDVRRKYRQPDETRIRDIASRLDRHFQSQNLGRGTKVLPYHYEEEDWYLIRHPGQPKRQGAYQLTGETTDVFFTPEEYDAAVYHRTFGDLRLNTSRHKEHAVYRDIFAEVLLETPALFAGRRRIVTLEPLKQTPDRYLACADIQGLDSIGIVEVAFTELGHPDRVSVWRSPSGSPLAAVRDTAPLLPCGTDTVQKAKFLYRLANDSKSYPLTVHAGRCLNYARDGDSSVLEQWLRMRHFIQDPFVR